MKSQKFKDRISNLKYMKLIKWEDDSTIVPWDSAHFAEFDELYNVIPLKEQAKWE